MDEMQCWRCRQPGEQGKHLASRCRQLLPAQRDPKYEHDGTLNCERCGGQHHLSSHCLWPGKPEPKVHEDPSIWCYRCGEQGHIARFCQHKNILLHPSRFSVEDLRPIRPTVSTGRSCPTAYQAADSPNVSDRAQLMNFHRLMGKCSSWEHRYRQAESDLNHARYQIARLNQIAIGPVPTVIHPAPVVQTADAGPPKTVRRLQNQRVAARPQEPQQEEEEQQDEIMRQTMAHVAAILKPHWNWQTCTPRRKSNW